MVETGGRINLSTHINELVRFKLHELTEMKEGVIRFVEYKRIHWMQKA